MRLANDTVAPEATITATWATRTASFTMSRGHRYTLRVRAIDRSGNVGLFATRYRYI